MPRDDDDDDLDDLDDDYEDDIDLDDDDDEDGAYPCPECGNLVYGDASNCPRCGYYYIDHQPWYYAAPRSFASYLYYKPLVIAVVVMLLCIFCLSFIPR